MASTQYKVSVALDIGGSSTGYAIKEFDRSSADVLYPEWGADGERKTKSSILFTPEKEFAAFGHEAELKMTDLVRNGEDKKWFYFDNLKRVLLGKCVSILKYLLLISD